jgi:hypothetical protein
LVVRGELTAHKGSKYFIKVKETIVLPNSETRVGARSTVEGFVSVSAVKIVMKDGKGVLERQMYGHTEGSTRST